jgi:hypothetical protein
MLAVIRRSGGGSARQRQQQRARCNSKVPTHVRFLQHLKYTS